MALAGSVAVAGCGASPPAGPTPVGVISVVAAENTYGSVAAQVGGHFVRVTSVEANPNTDPHTYEVSPGVAASVSAAGLVIQNGLGYDSFMAKVESASPNARRQVIDVQRLLGRPSNTPNPHLWYDPATMPKVASALAADLSKLAPAHASYFRANATSFVSSLRPWLAAIASFKAHHTKAPVATTEPVADYLLSAMGADNLTPYSFQADIMNGVDPSPQGVALEKGLLSQHKVKVLVYNQQVTDTLTASLVDTAKSAGIPVVGVYETMPTPGYDYQSWMLAEMKALTKAVDQQVSTVRL
ncbi:MAG: metal ABC transporter solute-binding protein, Zn/Mn family [Acidimicrobiales bacterium]